MLEALYLSKLVGHAEDLLCSPWPRWTMGSSRQEYWSGLPFPTPGDLPHPGIKPGSPALQEVSLLSESPGKPIYISSILFRLRLWVAILCLVAQSCPTFCDPMNGSPPGSSVHGILQARLLEWLAISFSRGSSSPRNQTQISHIAGRCFCLWATREAQN